MGPRVAFFLGAGSSKHFGLPITREIVPDIIRRLRSDELFADVGLGSREERRSRRDLRKYLQTFAAGLDAARSPTITELLSALDEMVRTGSVVVPGFRLDELRDVRVLLERAILEVIEDRELVRKRDLDVLARSLYEAGSRGRCGIVSTNYDNCVELALFGRIDHDDPELDEDSEDALWLAPRVDFGTSWREVTTDRVMHRPGGARHAAFNLHGSFNWLRCPRCEHLYINPYVPIAYLRSMEVGAWNACVCGYRPMESLIVAPSLVRDIRESNLLSIWRAALEELREADLWVVIGYSLPQEDLAIRSLLLRAYHARRRPPRVLVIQRSDASRAAYELLFPGCRYEAGGMGWLMERFHESGPERAVPDLLE